MIQVNVEIIAKPMHYFFSLRGKKLESNLTMIALHTQKGGGF